MKRALFTLLSLLVVLIGTALIAPNFLDLASYKGKAAQEIEKRTGLTVDLAGDLEFSVLPFPRLELTNVSIAAPEKSKDKTLIILDALNVHVALMPLLSGEIKVTSVTAVKPVVSLERFKDGKINALTPQIESMLSSEEGRSTEPTANLSLDQVTIRDGAFSFYDHASERQTQIQNINADLNAETLQGPYAASGSLFFEGNALSFDMESEAYDFESQVLSPKLTISLQPYNIEINFAGAVSFADAMSIQGQTSMRVENVGKLVSGYSDVFSGRAFETKGLLTADVQKLDYKNFDFTLGNNKGAGSLRVDLDPFKYSLSLKTLSNIVLEDFNAPTLPFKSGAFELVAIGDEDTATLKSGTFKLDDQIFKVNGSYQANKKTSRPEIDVSIQTNAFDYSKIKKSMAASSGERQSAQELIRNLSLPVDLKLDFAAQKLIWENFDVKGFNAKAKFSDSNFTLSKLSAVDIAGATVDLSFKIADLHKTSGVESYIDITAADIKKLAQSFAIDTKSWPQSVDKAQIKAKLTGDINTLAMQTNIKAIGGELVAKGKVKSPLDQMTLSDLIVQLKHTNMAQALKVLGGVSLEDSNLTKSLDVYAEINQSGKKYTLKNFKGDLSGTTVQGELVADISTKKPTVSGDLRFGKVNLDSIMTSSSGGSSKATAQKNKSSSVKSSRWSKNPIDSSALHAMNLDIDLSANKIVYGAWPLENPSLKITVQEGTMTLTDLKAGLFSGSLKMNSKIQTVSEARQPLYFETEMNVLEADLKPLSAALIGTKLVDISGRGNLEMSIKSSGASPAALIHDLSGSGEVVATDIILDGVDVTKFARALSEEGKVGDSVLGMWKGASSGGQTNFNTLDGNFKIENGIVNINKMDLDGDTAAIETRGNINLPNWTLATKHKMIVKDAGDVPSDVPPFEVSFNGSLDNPAQTFGQGLLQDYLNRKVQRKLNKIISDKIGLPANDNAPEQQQPAAGDEETPLQGNPSQKQPADIEDVAEEALKGVLDGLLR